MVAEKIIYYEGRMDDFDKLIPELKLWNGGSGIDPESWVSHTGRFDLAVGYSLMFWPSFVEHKGYILSEGFSTDSLESFEQTPARSKASIEWVMNHIHVLDLHGHDTPSEEQVRYLGRNFSEIHRVKLAHDFPEREFIVEFNDEPGLELIDYQFSFWQKTTDD